MSVRRTFAIVAAALTLVAPCSAAPITFTDTFSPVSALWDPVGASVWSDAGDVYQATLPNTEQHTLLPFVLANFIVDVDINNVSDGGLWLRTDAALDNGLLLITGGFGGTGTGFYFHSFVGGVASAPLGQVNNLFNPGDEIHVRVTAIGDTYSVYLNNNPSVATFLTTSAFASGFTGLYENSASQSFDDFELNEQVPEPATLPLLVTGIGAIAARRYRRSRSR